MTAFGQTSGKISIRRQGGSLVLGQRADRLRHAVALLGRLILLAIASSSALAVLFIFYFIIRDAIPFFHDNGLREFFTSTHWYPSNAAAPEFGALAIFYGTGMVTVGAIVVAVPLGVAAAVCLSDVLPFSVRQWVKPTVEILAAIPSVVYGFFALVVFAPLLQDKGGQALSVATWLLFGPLAALAILVVADVSCGRLRERFRNPARAAVMILLTLAALAGLWKLSAALAAIHISSGTNALNASIILGVMALPTIVSVSEDALTAAGRELREGSYALGATRAETILSVIIPAASSGIMAAVILGIMRAIGETMVVLMASGNAAQIPQPWYNFLSPVRTMTATIVSDMGEADQTTGSSRYHVLFAMALCLLVVSFLANLASEWVVRRTVAKISAVRGTGGGDAASRPQGFMRRVWSWIGG